MPAVRPVRFTLLVPAATGPSQVAPVFVCLYHHWPAWLAMVSVAVVAATLEEVRPGLFVKTDLDRVPVSRGTGTTR